MPLNFLTNSKKDLSKNLKTLILLITFLLSSHLVYAVDFYWKTTGRADQNYTNVANWESAPGSGLAPNGTFAPSSSDNVIFPSGNLGQTITANTGSICANMNILASGVITFASGDLTVTGSFTSNAKHQFGASLTLNFNGNGNHTINMGDNLSHSTSVGAINFNGTGTYTFLSDLTLANRTIYVNNSTIIANGKTVSISAINIASSATGTKTINFSNSKLITNGGIANVGAIIFGGSPATTTYNFTNAEITLNQNSSSFISMIVNGVIVDGIKSITYNENTGGNGGEDFRGSTSLGISTTIGVTDLNINVSTFNFTNSSAFNLNVTNLNIASQTNFQAELQLRLKINSINFLGGACNNQSILQTIGATKIDFNATSPITTTAMAFKGINFTGNTVNMSSTNNLGLNIGNFTTNASAPSRTFYWVGGAGNWNDPTKWSLIGSGGTAQTSAGCVPTLNDDVYFDANSFASASQVVTITDNSSTVRNNNAYAKNIYWLSPNRGVLGSASSYISISGSADFTGATGVLPTIQFIGSLNSNTIKSGLNFVYASPTIEFLGKGTYTLLDDLKASVTTIIYHKAGKIITNGKILEMSIFRSFSAPYSADNFRDLDLSNSIINCLFSNTSATDGFSLNVAYLNSFLASGSSINLKGSVTPALLLTGYGAATPAGAIVLTTLSFNDINFTSNVANATLNNYGAYNFEANNISLGSNTVLTTSFTQSANSFKVGNLNLTPGKSYTLSTGSYTNYVYTILNGINMIGASSCSPLATIKSGTNGTKVKIYKAGLPFNTSFLAVKDVNANGATLTVQGGQDLGGNTNVNIITAPSQNFYWVGGTGNWSDATHWSIGVSGGDPLITNVNSCLPTMLDDVFFDANSFSSTNQIVTLNQDGSCRNMTWNVAVDSKTPVFTGANNINLNVYGSVILASKLSSSFAGNMYMKGTATAINANSLITNGINLVSAIFFNGGGRYDLLDNLKTNNVIVFSLGGFYTNSHNISAKALTLTVTGTNSADISNSTLTLDGVNNIYTYIATHGNNNWNAVGSVINCNYRYFVTSFTSGINTISYGAVNMNPFVAGSYISSGTGLVKFTNVTWLSAESAMLGDFEIGDLTYKLSSNNSLTSGKTIKVLNKLSATGTPCNPIRFFANTAGTPAIISSANCSFDIKFARLTDITAGTCAVTQNKVIGDNVKGNSNWTFSTIENAEYLGSDQTLNCNQYPFSLSTAGFNESATSYLWSNGATTPDISATVPGTYRVTVTYGLGCTLSDEIILNVVPNPTISSATLKAKTMEANTKIGSFNLSDANMQVVSNPSNYVITYYLTQADATAGQNALPNLYNSLSKSIFSRAVLTSTGCFNTNTVKLMVFLPVLANPGLKMRVSQ